MHSDCLFCTIASDRADPSIVAMDDLTMTLIHRRQGHHAHFLVVPRQHVADIHGMDDATIEALMRAVTRVAQAIDMESLGEQISIWKSGHHASGTRHVHFHVHPRRLVRAPSSERGVLRSDLPDIAASRWRMRLASIPAVADHRPLMQHPDTVGHEGCSGTDSAPPGGDSRPRCKTESPHDDG